MGERWRMAYIALTAVVVVLAIASAILSAAGPKSPQSEALYTPRVTPSPSPRLTFTPQSPTSTPVATSTPSPSPTSTPVPTRTPRPSPTFTPYVVQAGETLGAIARTFGVTVQAILAANPDITDPGYVKAGQRILIPPLGWAPSPSPSSSSS